MTESVHGLQAKVVDGNVILGSVVCELRVTLSKEEVLVVGDMVVIDATVALQPGEPSVAVKLACHKKYIGEIYNVANTAEKLFCMLSPAITRKTMEPGLRLVCIEFGCLSVEVCATA